LPKQFLLHSFIFIIAIEDDAEVLRSAGSSSRDETLSGNITRELEDIERVWSEMARTIARIEHGRLGCKRLAELGAFLGNTTLEKLDTIRGIREERDGSRTWNQHRSLRSEHVTNDHDLGAIPSLSNSSRDSALFGSF
jgi:hypothetical protein